MGRKNPIVAKIESRIEDILKDKEALRNGIASLEREELELRNLLDSPAVAKRVRARAADAGTGQP